MPKDSVLHSGSIQLPLLNRMMGSKQGAAPVENARFMQVRLLGHTERRTRKIHPSPSSSPPYPRTDSRKDWLLTRAPWWLHHRFKPEMWAKVAEEMQVPWRAAEAMHWQLGEADMARRAGVVPFSLSSANVAQEAISSSGGNSNNLSSNNSRQSPSRGHAHSQSQGSVPRVEHDYLLSRYQNRGRGAPPPPYQATHAHHHAHHQHLSHPPHPLTIPAPIATIPLPGPARGGSGGGGPLTPRRESMPPRPPPGDFIYDSGSLAPGPGLAPIQPRERGGGGAGGGGVGGGMQLPGLAELTTGVSPYSTPAYSLGGASASPSATASPRQAALQGPTPLGYGESPGGAHGSTKRGRSSPDAGRQATRRRH